ncbi:MAG TPA: TonB-dependent receptor [Candidatus Acidoferrum sp.]|nr:TonB-dependent receptor [Candidatus Acidoferrum sp.]
MKVLRGALWLLAGVKVLAGSAAAQESKQNDLGGMSLEELAKVKVESVYGAAKFLQKASDVPSSVTVVTAEQIQKYGYRTLADVLKSVRGFYVINDRNYSYVGVRGFSRPGDVNARILFLVDGHRVNENIFDGAYVGTEFPVDIDLIERIEVTRGPSSSVYGAGAFVAVVNVITKRGRDVSASEVSSDVGSWNSYKGRATYGSRLDNGFETLVSGSFYNSAGHERLFYPEFNSPATNNGIAEDVDGEESYSFFADLIYRDFNIHLVDASRTKHIPTASFGTVFNDPNTRTTDARAWADIQYHHTFGSWETLGRASFDRYRYEGIYIADLAGTGVPPYTQVNDEAYGTWLDFEGDASRVFFKRHNVTAGTELRQDLQMKQWNYNAQPYLLNLEANRSARDWAVYFQDEYFVRKNFAFVAGLRSDWHDRYKNKISPRLGLLYSPTQSTDIKATYSWAFREPNGFETLYSSNVNPTGPGLDPELIRSWQLEVEHRFGKTYRVLTGGFLNRMDGVLEQQINPAFPYPVFSNSPPEQSKGLEWEFAAQWASGMEGTISHSLQDSRILQTGAVMTNSPKQLVKANLSIPLQQRKIFAGLEAQYVSKRRTIPQTELGGYLLLNATLFSRKLTERFDISASVYNLLNKPYAESGGLEHLQTSIPQDGRSLRFKLTYRPRVSER